MTQEFALYPMHIRQKGVFDFEKLYNFVYEWMHDRRYRTQEDKYKWKPDSAYGYEHEVKIFGRKKVDGYYRYILKIILHVRDGTWIEHDGKTLLKGRIHVTFTGKVVTDYSGRFEKNKFTKLLEKMYTTITKKELELAHWDILYYRVMEFQQEMKKILSMYADENYWKGS